MRMKLLCISLLIVCIGSVAAGADQPADAEQSSPFSGAFTDSIWTALAFVALLFVLWRFAWKPMLAGLKSRQEYIEKQITDAEDTKDEAHKLLAEYERKLADANDEGKRLIQARVEEAERQSREVIENAKTEMEQMRLKVETEIERARREAEAELVNKSGEIILKLGEQILGRAMDQKDNQRLIDQAIRRLKAEESD